jgi:hypothetical protein
MAQADAKKAPALTGAHRQACPGPLFFIFCTGTKRRFLFFIFAFMLHMGQGCFQDFHHMVVVQGIINIFPVPPALHLVLPSSKASADG